MSGERASERAAHDRTVEPILRKTSRAFEEKPLIMSAQNARVELERMGGGLAFRACAENNMRVCSLGGFRLKSRNAGRAPLAAPSTGLPEYLRVRAREISSVRGNKTRLPPAKRARGRQRGKRRIVRALDTHCIQERPCCCHAGSFPCVGARCCWRRCQTLRGAVLAW